MKLFKIYTWTISSAFVDPDWDELEINWAEGVQELNDKTRKRKAKLVQQAFEDVKAHYESLKHRFNYEAGRLREKRWRVEHVQREQQQRLAKAAELVEMPAVRKPTGKPPSTVLPDTVSHDDWSWWHKFIDYHESYR